MAKISYSGYRFARALIGRAAGDVVLAGGHEIEILSIE
jgi:transcription elongation GreA/GreB family factor